jgi:hypothetical protein
MATMKTVLTAVPCLLLISFSSPAQNFGGAQRAAGGVTFVNPTGFGNVVYPGTGGPLVGSAPRYTPVYTTQFYQSQTYQTYQNQLFPSQLAATVNGTGVYARQGRRTSGGGGVAYPVYIGGGYAPAYPPDYSGQTQLVDPQQQYSAPAPPVIINQYFSQPPPDPITAPSSEIYRAAPSAAPSSDETSAQKYYLLAFKDHSVYSAIAYWIEDKTLHYVTPQNAHNQASLDLVDLDFTRKLNLNRDVPFTAPPAQ